MQLRITIELGGSFPAQNEEVHFVRLINKRLGNAVANQLSNLGYDNRVTVGDVTVELHADTDG